MWAPCIGKRNQFIELVELELQIRQNAGWIKWIYSIKSSDQAKSQIMNCKIRMWKMNWNLGVIIYRLSHPGRSQEFALLGLQERKGASFMGPNLSDVHESKWVFKISLCWVLPSDCFYCCYFISSFSALLLFFLKEHDHWLFHTHIFIDANGLKPVEVEIEIEIKIKI